MGYLCRFRCFRPIKVTNKVKDAILVCSESFMGIDVSEPASDEEEDGLEFLDHLLHK